MPVGRRKCIRALALGFILLLTVTRAQSQGGGQGGNQGTSKSTTSNPDSVHDIVAISFAGSFVLLSAAADPKPLDVLAGMQSVEARRQLTWDNTSTGLEGLVEKDFPPQSASGWCGIVDQNQIYLFHIVHWKPAADSKGQLVSSGWYAYKYSQNKKALVFSGFTGTGDQLIYGKRKALIVSLSVADSTQDQAQTLPDNFAEQYEVSVIPGTPENAQDLGLLVSALTGTAAKAKALAEVKLPPPPAPTKYYLAEGCQSGSAKLPYTLTVKYTATTATTDKPTTPSTGGTLACSQDKLVGNVTPCSGTHSFVSKDREWWDVSVGVTTPGIREKKFSFSSGAVQSSITRHTDVYGMFDIFPAAAKIPKDSWFPHINVGLPLASQSFYRPYFGLAENLTSWTGIQKKLSLPVGINFFAGLIFMKEKLVLDNPTTQSAFNTDLTPTRVWKGVFGIEIPVSSALSKIGSKSSSAKSTSSSGSGSGS